MPLTRPNLVPGIYQETTKTSAEGHWYDADKVRFRWGQPQKIGGWTLEADFSAYGTTRRLLSWAGGDNVVYTAVGTNSKLLVFANGSTYNITPIRKTSSLTNAWSTVISTPTVTVADTSHGAIVGDTLSIAGPISIGGLSLSGDYVVLTVPDANSYTFSAGSNATSTVSSGGGGPHTVKYEINIGTVDSALGGAWGASTWGSGTWGGVGTGETEVNCRTWSLDHWGTFLVANPAGGNIYKWDPVGDGTGTRASVITNSPTECTAIVVSPEKRFLIAVGCNNNSAGFDPLAVAWCDEDDYTTWSPSITNSAGQIHITGKQIVTAIRAKTEIIIFTIDEVHTLEYIAGDLIFGSNLISDNMSIASPMAAVEFDGQVFWMGKNNFFLYNGTCTVLPSPVRTHVYNRLNIGQINKCFVGVNQAFRELWFFYPVGNEVDTYVIYSPPENSWSIGTMDRTAWESCGFHVNPYATDSSGIFWKHETGTDAGGSAMTAYIESAYFDIADGQQLMYIDKYLPDLDMTGKISLTFKTLKYPGSSTVSKGPFTVTPLTQRVDLRARGRYGAIRWESNNLGDSWTLSSVRFNAQPDGLQ